MLHNSVLFGKKFTSNDKSNAFVSKNMNDCEEINIYCNNSFQNTFWSWNGFKWRLFYPTNTCLDIKICDLIWINIEIQSARKMWPKLSWKTASISSIKTHFNDTNMLTSNDWNKYKICGNKINKLIKCFIQKAMKLAIIWLLWPSIINKCCCVWSSGCVFGSKTMINYS